MLINTTSTEYYINVLINRTILPRDPQASRRFLLPSVFKLQKNYLIRSVYYVIELILLPNILMLSSDRSIDRHGLYCESCSFSKPNTTPFWYYEVTYSHYFHIFSLSKQNKCEQNQIPYTLPPNEKLEIKVATCPAHRDP